MSDIVDRITAVLREADFYAKRPDHYYQLLAARVAAELQLTEETVIRKCYDPRCDDGGAHTHHERRWVSAYEEVTP